ncbi:hypothetical protein FQN57_006321 [Myotisia sp. PD_48]|nr:hypothetical protein FQN57_006321 [Myotisia sp. PD_48]
MSSATSFLVRRGLEITQVVSGTTPSPTSVPNDGKKQIIIAPWAYILFGLTAIGFVVAFIAVQYTYGMVVATLATVEDPSPNVYTAIEVEDDPNGTPKNPDELSGAEHTGKPITSQLRTTVRHLRSRAGPWSRFRGFGVFIVWNICRGILMRIFTFGASSKYLLLHAGAQILAEVAVTNLTLTWVHIVISEPSSKSWIRRIPSLRGNWLKAAPAVALNSVASQLSFLLPMYLAQLTGSFRLDDSNLSLLASDGEKPSPGAIGGGLASIALSLALVVFLEIPAAVTMIRVAASMLPSDDEPIVPFDRTFGGKAVPVALGEPGKVGLLDAWKTFSKSSRSRLIKVLLKTFGILLAISLVCGLALGLEILLLRDSIFKQLMQANRS